MLIYHVISMSAIAITCIYFELKLTIFKRTLNLLLCVYYYIQFGMNLSCLASLIFCVCSIASAVPTSKDANDKVSHFVDGVEMKALLALYDSEYIGKPVDGLQSISYSYIPANATPEDISTIVGNKGVRVVEQYGNELEKRKICCTVSICSVEVIKVCIG